MICGTYTKGFPNNEVMGNPMTYMWIPLNTCSIAILFSITSIFYHSIYLFIHLFYSIGNICTCNTEENGTAITIKGIPIDIKEIPMMSLLGNPLVQVVAQGGLFSWINQILLNPDKFSQIFRLWVKQWPPVVLFINLHVHNVNIYGHK